MGNLSIKTRRTPFGDLDVDMEYLCELANNDEIKGVAEKVIPQLLDLNNKIKPTRSSK